MPAVFYMNGKNGGTGTSNSEDTLTSLTSEGLAKKYLIEQYVQVNSSVFELPQRESVVSNLACANPEILSLSIVTPLESSIVTKDYAMLQVTASGKALAPLDQTNFYTVGSGKRVAAKPRCESQGDSRRGRAAIHYWSLL